MKFIKPFFTILVILFLGMNFAFAGSSCDPKNPDPKVLNNAMQRAVALNQALDQLHPKVALIARVGSDITKYGLYYTHVAFVVRDYPGRKGQWTVIHLLNQCGTAHSSIFAQGLTNFFMDDLFNMDFQISVPTDAVQQKILKTLYSPAKLALHDTHYSMLAFPFATRYQNSNQWVLEILTSALTGEQTRAAVQKDLASTGFKPSVIQISHFSKLGAHLFKANVSFDDHPAAEQHSNRFSIVSVDSVIRYLDDHHNLSLNKEYRKS